MEEGDLLSRSPAERRELTWVSTIAVLYLGIVLFREEMFGFLGLPSTVTTEFLRTNGDIQELAALALYLIPGLALLLVLWKFPAGMLRSALRASTAGGTVVAVLLTWAISIVMDAAGVWPFLWNRPNSPEGDYVAALIVGGQLASLAFLAIRSAILVPLLEEVIFRFVVLRRLIILRMSPAIANAFAALIFAALHLPGWPPATGGRQLLHAFWLFCGSLILGWLVLRQKGRIGTAVAIHSARNTLETALLLVYTNQALRQSIS